MNLIRKCLLVLLAVVMTQVKADPISPLYYFYFWAESYKVDVDASGKTYLMTHIKTSDASKFTFTVNGTQVATNMLVIPDEIVDFPITLGGRYTKGERVIVCSSKSSSQVTFKQEICLNIRLNHQ